MYENCILAVVAELALWGREVCVVSAAKEKVLKGNLLQNVMIFLPTMLMRQICKSLPVIKKPRKSLTRQAQGPGVVNGKRRLAVFGLRCFPCFRDVSTHRSIIEGAIGLRLLHIPLPLPRCTFVSNHTAVAMLP